MILIHRIAAVAMLSLSMVAVAQNTIVESADGRGVAAGRDNRIGQFNFRVAHVIRDGESKLVGNLHLEVRVNRTTPPIVLMMRQPGELEVNGFNAAFAGPAKMVIVTRDGRRPIEGRLVARVADNRGPGRPSREADALAVRFVPAAADARPFEFAGAVREGDIRVRDAQ